MRHRVHAGVVESPHRADVEKLLGLKGSNAAGSGRYGDLEVLTMLEHSVVTLLVDIVMAMGPRGFVVLEDFVLGTTGGVSGARAGLSSPRITHRLVDRLWERGCVSGDAWREYTGHGWAGEDRRGWRVKDGVVPSFYDRLTAVERWRLEGVSDEAATVWGGVGCKVVWRMPSQRSFLKNVKQMDDWLRNQGMWMKNRRHGMDALQHACTWARELGAEIHAEPEPLWRSGAKTDGKRVTAKSANPAHMGDAV